MKCKMTNEQILLVISSAPEGSQFYTDGYDVKYRKVVGDKYFGYLDEAKGWVETCDKELSQERIDKGWWIPNLTKALEYRGSQTKEVEWANGDIANTPDGEGCLVAEVYRDGYSYWIVQFKDNFHPFDLSELSKPETEEQKLEREELEAAYFLYSEWAKINGYPKLSQLEFNSTKRDKASFLSIVRITNYKVKGE